MSNFTIATAQIDLCQQANYKKQRNMSISTSVGHTCQETQNRSGKMQLRIRSLAGRNLEDFVIPQP